MFFFSTISMAAALFLFFLALAITTSDAEPNYLSHFCSNTTTFTSNSTYQYNLNLLLSSLASYSGFYDSGFYNTTIGQTPDDTVYGLFLCRGDLSTDVCQDCVTFATQDVVQRCPIQKVTVIWYDECLLRYSNQSIFNNVSDATVIMYNAKNSTYPASYQEDVHSLLDDVRRKALYNENMFAVGAEYFYSSHMTLYALAQCTLDLTEINCLACLQLAISTLTNDSKTGTTMMPSCFVRYETYLFYYKSEVPHLLSAPLLPLFPSSSPLYFPPPPLDPLPPASPEGNF